MKQIHMQLAAMILCSLFVSGGALADSVSCGELPQKADGKAAGFVSTVDAAVTRHLELGTRITGFWLVNATDNSKNTRGDYFIGSVNHLEAKQNVMPLKIFADWMFNEYVGVELTWDQIQADAMTATSDGHMDGAFEASGPIAAVVLRYPTGEEWTPFLMAGIGIFNGSFDEKPWWQQGFSSEQDWVDAGMPDRSVNGKYRTMDIAEPTTWIVGGGFQYMIRRHIACDVLVRYMSVELSDHYYIDLPTGGVDDRGTYTIPMSNIGAGAGLKMVF